MKDCLYTPKNSKKDYNYDEFRAYLLRNHSWWSGVAKDLAPSVLSYKATTAAAPSAAPSAAAAPKVNEKKVAQNKAVLSKATQRIKAGFDAITKAMGMQPKVEFLTEDQARKMLATRNDLNKLIAGFGMTKQDLQAAVKFGIANELEQKGFSPIDIKLQTGWERGADGDWRFEIGDARIKKSAFNKVIANNEAIFDDLEAAEENIEQFETRFNLGELINSNSEFLKKYPSAKNIKVVFHPLSGYEQQKELAQYDYPNNQIDVYLSGMSVEDINLEEIESSLNHEIQHYIQMQEGFAIGGSPSNVFLTDTESGIGWEYKVYRNLAGEAEARNVQERMKMSAAEKLRTLLENSEDVPRINQIIIKNPFGVLEGRDFTIDADGQITNGASDDFDNMMKSFNWKELDSDYTDYDYLKSPTGKVLGFVAKEKDGTYKVYIDPTAVGSETPIHEIAGHIFLPIIKEVAPDLYNRGVQLVEGSEYESRLKELGYQFKTKAETAAEALAQAIGDRGKKLSDSKKGQFIEWLKTMWQKVGDILKINISPEKLQNMNLGQFADFIAGSIVYGQEISEMEASPVVAPPGNTTMSIEQAQTLVDTTLSDIYLDATMRDPEMARMRDVYLTQAAGKIAAKGKVVMEALKEDVREYLTKGATGVQKYTGAAMQFIKSMGERVKKAAIIAVIAATSIVGTMKATASTNFTAAANSIKTELVNLGVMSKSVANESFAAIKTEIQKAYETTEKPTSGEPSSSAPIQALFFGLAIPIVTRKKILTAIQGKDIADAKEEAYNILVEDGLEDMVDPLMAQMDERYEAKSEAQYLADHIERMRAAQKLTPAQAKNLMQHFRNFLQSEEDLDEAIEFVDKLAEKKDMMEKLAKAKTAFVKLKSLRNSKKLTIYDKSIARKIQAPRYYLLDADELDMVADMANDFYTSRLSEKKPKYKDADLVAAFDKLAQKKPKKQKTKRKTRANTVSMLQFKAEQALTDYASKLPLAKQLLAQDLSVIGKDKDTLIKILNALKAFDETGIVYDLGGIYEMVRALNEAKKIRNTPVISNLNRLAAGGISAKLQFDKINADEVRRILFGGWDRNAAKVTADNNRQRLDIDIKFDKLNIGLNERFLLGAYSFFKELSGNQLPKYKASVLANQMNELNDRIVNAKNFGSNSSTVESFVHYYTGATNALSQLGILKKVNGKWEPNAGFETGEFGVAQIESSVPDNVLKAWEYSRQILNEKHESYLEAMQSYHGRDYDEIESYWPRTFIRTKERQSELQDTSVALPALGNLGEEGVNQNKEIAARNKGRLNMPNSGGFYVLDGYETLVNGLWDINATTNLSKDYAYTNALINRTTLVENEETNKAVKKYIVSSVKGILRDPLLFVDSRQNWEKIGSILLNAATTTVLNNFTQLFKQPMALAQGFRTNKNGSFAAAKLLLQSIKNPELNEALNKFFNNTSEPYTSQLAHIELETAYRVQPNKYVKKINNVLDFLRPQSLIAANRLTQRVLLLSEYLDERGYIKNAAEGMINDAINGFDENALAAAENNAEAANSTANRHFLPIELKEAGVYKKFLYFLGTYTFVAVNQFFNNINIVRSPGYTGYQKQVAWTQIYGFVIQQLMFQIASKAIYESVRGLGREMDWLEEEDPEKKKERREKYWYQVPSQVLTDIVTGWLPSFWGDSIKLSANTIAEVLQDRFSETDEEKKDVLQILYKKSNEFPGPLGVIAPMIAEIYKALDSNDKQYTELAMAQAASMALQIGDAYYILKLKSQAVKSVLSVEGNEDVFKAMRMNNPIQFKEYVNTARKAGVSDDVLHYMAWREGDTGYYIEASNAARFLKLFKENYQNEYRDLKEMGEIKGELKLQQAAKNSAAMLTQYEFDPIEITLPEK